MISFSGRVLRQCNKLISRPTVNMSFTSSSKTIIVEQTRTNIVHKPPKKPLHHDSKKRSVSPPKRTTSPLQEDIAVKAAQMEKLRLKQEREKLEQLKAENNARFSAYLAALPLLAHPNHYKVECISNMEAANHRLRQLMSNKGQDKIFGLDLEWPPTFIKGRPENKVSLVQICGTDTILLIQIARMPALPTELVKFFQDKSSLKSGVNIGADGLKLFRDFGIITNGLVELRDMAEQTNSSKMGITHLRSLRALTGIFLDQNMAKGKVRISNWAKAELTPIQKKYAALDAYASYQLFIVLNELKADGQPIKIRHLIDENMKKDGKRVLNNNKTKQNFPSCTTTIIKKKS